MGIGVSDQAKILFVKSATSAEMSAPQELCSLFDVEVADDWSEARRLMKQQCFDGALVTPLMTLPRNSSLRIPSG